MWVRGVSSGLAVHEPHQATNKHEWMDGWGPIHAHRGPSSSAAACRAAAAGARRRPPVVVVKFSVEGLEGRGRAERALLSVSPGMKEERTGGGSLFSFAMSSGMLSLPPSACPIPALTHCVARERVQHAYLPPDGQRGGEKAEAVGQEGGRDGGVTGQIRGGVAGGGWLGGVEFPPADLAGHELLCGGGGGGVGDEGGSGRTVSACLWIARKAGGRETPGPARVIHTHARVCVCGWMRHAQHPPGCRGGSRRPAASAGSPSGAVTPASPRRARGCGRAPVGRAVS